MSDTLHCSTRFRPFNVIDDFNREVLAIEVENSLRAERVSRILKLLKAPAGVTVYVARGQQAGALTQRLQALGEDEQSTKV